MTEETTEQEKDEEGGRADAELKANIPLRNTEK